MPAIFNRGYSFAEITTKDGISEIQILKTGKWKHPTYWEFNITDKDINEFVSNYKNNVRGIDLAVDINHDPEHKAVGWFKDVYKKGKAAFAKIEWTKEGLDLIKTKTYRYFSPELHFVFQDEETGEKLRNVLVGGGITNRPFFKGMQALQMSEPEANAKQILFYNTDNMKFKELFKTLEGKTTVSLEELDQARLAFSELNETEQDANAKNIAAIEAKFNEEEENEEDDGDDEGQEGEGQEEDGEGEDEDEDEGWEEEDKEDDAKNKEFNESEEWKAFNEMLKQTTGMTLDEVKDVQKKFSEQAKQLKEKDLNEKVGTLVFSESNSKGTFLPKSKDKLVGFLSKLNDNLVKEFFEIVPNAIKTVEFKELGKEGTEAKTFSVPTNTPKGVSRESFVLAEVAKVFAEKEGLDIGEATLKAADYITANNLK